MTMRWYVVFEGRVPGVYDKWEDCFKQVNKFRSNNYKGFKTREEAEARYKNYRRGR
jgi:ribonuclease HI